jgi:uncharacterized membrane protein YoaK (UPF0700 family)
VKQHLRDAWETLAPPKGNPHGPLPPLLILLTMVTGLVDAFSYLSLGRVFVANMTGNVVFLSFDLAGAAGFVWWASLLAIVTFVAGAFVGGRIGHRVGGHRGRHLYVAVAVQTTLVAVAFVLALVFDAPYSDGGLVVLILLLGVGMGLQNATARALAVPDLTTTVLTLTLTGLSADSVAAGGTSSKLGRRLLSILSMFVGGLVGTVIVVKGNGAFALLVALGLLVAVIAGAAGAARSTEAWATK